MKYDIFVYLLVLLASCNDVQEVEGKPIQSAISNDKNFPIIITVDSTLSRSENSILNFYYHDSIGHGHPVLLHEGDTKIMTSSPILLIQSDENQTPFYILPGEHLYLKKDQNDKTLILTKDNELRNNELLLFEKIIERTGSLYVRLLQPALMKKSDNSKRFNEFEQGIVLVKNKRLRFIDSFNLRHNISHEFKNLAISMIDYAAINDQLLLIWKSKQLWQSKTDYQNKVMECIRELDSMKFTSHYICYWALNNAVSISNSPFIENQVLSTKDFETKFSFTESNFTNESKNFLLANLISKAVSYQIAIPKNYIDSFYAINLDSNYKRLVSLLINEQNTTDMPKGSNKLLLADGVTKQDLQSVLKRYAGRVILVDFWASWCSPCRQEMPFSAKLKEEYQNKNVVFLYISTDENKEDWQKASIEENLSKKNNFLFLNYQNSSFAQQYQLQTIPRYMLIGKDGKIINADAPRPSEAKLKLLLDSNL